MLISIICTRYFLWPAIELWLLRTHLYGPSFACFTGLEYMELLLHVKGSHRWSIEAATWILIVLSISILNFFLVYWLGRMELPEWECVSSSYDCFSFCFNLHHRQACCILWVCHFFNDCFFVFASNVSSCKISFSWFIDLSFCLCLSSCHGRACFHVVLQNHSRCFEIGCVHLVLI